MYFRISLLSQCLTTFFEDDLPDYVDQFFFSWEPFLFIFHFVHFWNFVVTLFFSITINHALSSSFFEFYFKFPIIFLEMKTFSVSYLMLFRRSYTYPYYLIDCNNQYAQSFALSHHEELCKYIIKFHCEVPEPKSVPFPWKTNIISKKELSQISKRKYIIIWGLF